MSFAGKMRGKLGKAKEAMCEYAYLFTLGAVVAIIAASAMYTQRVKTRFETSPEPAQVEAAANAPEVRDSAAASLLPRVTPLPTIAPLAVSVVGTGAGRVWPVSGDMVRGYAPDAPVFWEALSCYQVHTGVDIAGQPGESVLCVMDGVVERVTRDELWGTRVTIAQTDGSMAAYAGLSLCLFVEGQAVTRGQALGELLSAIPCEAELGAHLHLEVMRDGRQANPELLLQSAKRK